MEEKTNENLTAFRLGLGEKSVAELENMTLSAAGIPASISREPVDAKDHVLRLREQEADLNTVIFRNKIRAFRIGDSCYIICEFGFQFCLFRPQCNRSRMAASHSRASHNQWLS